MPEPLRSNSTGPVRQGPAPTKPMAPVEAAPSHQADHLALSRGPRLHFRPGPRVDTLKAPMRGVTPWVQGRIDTTVRSMFAQPPAAPVRQPQAVAAVAWDPAQAGVHSNGSLVAPAGLPTPQAPAPGDGPVPPPGLTDGNSVIRWGTDQRPSNFTVLDQGQTNGCGTTSLAMMLNYFAGDADFDRQAIDRFIRHFEMFTSPGDIAAFAEQRGFTASVHSGTTPAELRRLIDAGLPVQILIDVSESHDGSGLHYEVVTGYGKGPDGKMYYELANPNGRREYMAEDVLLEKWSNLGVAGFGTGIDRVAIALRPPGDKTPLPADSRGAFFDTGMTALRAAQGLTQVTSGWARRDPTRLTAGLLRLVVGGLGALPGLAVRPLQQTGQRLTKEGREQLGHGFGNTVAGLGKLLGGGALQGLAAPMTGLSSSVSWSAHQAARGVEWLGDKIGGLLG